MDKRGQMIPRGEKTWLLRVYLGRDEHGKRKYHSTMVGGSQTQARRELTRLLRSVDTKTLVRPCHQTLRSYVEEWLESKVQVSDTTRHDYRYQFDRYLFPTLGHLPLSEISSTAIQRTYNALRDQGLSPRTIEYGHALLHQVFKKAIRVGLLAANPTDNTERPRKVDREFTILSPAQMLTLLHSEQDKPLYPLWTLLLNTGLRPGEALALRWSDLDGDTIRVRRVLARKPDGSYQIVENRAKTKKSLRPVTLSSSVVEVLKAHRLRQAKDMLAWGQRYQRNDFIFATRFGVHLDANNVRNRWKSALKRAGLPSNVRLYDTRHSHATALLNAGVNLAWVSARLGHTSVQTTEMFYTKVLPEAHREMADVMERVFQKAAKA